nr:hypothetical protein BaRGS_021017 [Batillaria attramentaria]
MSGEKIDITPAQDGGVLKEILREGEGTEGPAKGDSVSVHYVGTLEDGTEFDSSRARGEHFKFTLGKDQVIKAWDIGVATMKKGELARFTCKAEYAYGENGSPPKIPPNATLIFEVELFSWEGEDLSKDGGIIRHLVKEGKGYSSPNDGATVTLKYKGFLDNKEFESREVTFVQGDGDEAGLIPGLEVATKKMKKGEVARLDIAPKYAYGKDGCAEKGVPGDARLVYEVEMVSFEKAKEAWEMNAAEKLEESKIVKEKGTAYFKKGSYSKAITNYKKIVSFLEHETSFQTDEEKQLKEQLLLAAHLNIAMCHLKLKEYVETEDSCAKVLEMDPDNVKALFRRGQALLERNEYESASADFERVIQLEPENKAAKNQLTLCKHREKQFREREKKLYANMFKKLAESKTMPEVGEWNNEMAKDMMPLQDEKAAFEDGEKGEGDAMETQNGSTANSATVGEDMDI